MNKDEDIITGNEYAFIDKALSCNQDCVPSFLYNDYKSGHKVLCELEREIRSCDEFWISVSFIRWSGINILLHALDFAKNKGIKGKILTTDYLLYSDPKALVYILKNYPNIELKMFRTEENKQGFHTKGYIFKKGNQYDIIIGSSNISQEALTKNEEWNTKNITTKDGQYFDETLNAFDNVWKKSISMAEWIGTYSRIYEENEKKKITISSVVKNVVNNEILKPNEMQVSFINNLEEQLRSGDKRTLLISATGTGKTYASAFALRDLKAKKVLYIAHREQILKQSIKSYQKIFGQELNCKLLTGKEKGFDGDFVFSTIQTLSKDDVYTVFSKDQFEYIVIDEVHKAGAKSYQKIFNYFEPKLFLGMTATPERTDGFDIYELFDHNIAYEIRLQQALEEDLLCPFHYFGITDFEENGETVNDFSDFKFLVCDKRVDFIVNKIKKYGYSGNRVKGLIFVSRKDEGREISEKFNEKGFNTIFLSGEESQEERQDAVERLCTSSENHLDYIITVDIFNEGIDIPEVNQVILLRPTQSPIIFVQQLGRGLRKFNNKEFVVILDFIGNYDNNYLIPMAMSGEKGKDKDSIRKYVSSGSSIIPGATTIEFDEIAKKKIYESLDKAKINKFSIIRNEYNKVKFRLGRIPTLNELEEYGSLSVPTIFASNSVDSYYQLLVNIEPEYKVRISDTAKNMLEFVSKKLVLGQRIYEILLLKDIILNKEYDEFINELKVAYKKEFTSIIKNSVISVLTNNFNLSSITAKKYEQSKFISIVNNNLVASDEFILELKDVNFKNMMLDVLNYAIHSYENRYKYSYKGTDLVLE
ncbi:MAG: DUF3427 domain-containing protein, partial [Bacilli bacterium]